jgi:hypothetical protein
MYPTSNALSDASNAFATSWWLAFHLRVIQRSLGQKMREETHSLVVTKISERGTSESRIARPTSCSFAGRLSRPIHAWCDQGRTISRGRVEVSISDLNARELQSVPRDEHDTPEAPSRPSHTPSRRHRALRANTCPYSIRHLAARSVLAG